MSNVPLHKRRKSKLEYDRIYHKIFREAKQIYENNFGLNRRTNGNEEYISVAKEKMISLILDIGTCLRVYSSHYPKTLDEFIKKMESISDAIGYTSSLLSLYQNTFQWLRISSNRYVTHIQHVIDLQDELIKIRKEDSKRYRKYIG